EDPVLSKIARKAAAGHLVTTILQVEENPLLRDRVFKPLVASLTAVEEAEVRFDVVARDLLSCKDKADCEQAARAVRGAIETAQRAVEVRSAVTENLLSSLLRGLPRAERSEVLEALAVALETTSLFTPRSDAWPEEVKPLSHWVRIAARSDTDYTNWLTERLAHAPCYVEELRFFDDRLATLAARRELIPLYSNLLVRLSDRRNILGVGELVSIQRRVRDGIAGRGEITGPLVALEQELRQVLSLTESVNSDRIGSGRETGASSRLQQKLQSLRKSYCSALEAHGPPVECDHAA
ncbi:MAG: hypothetical protein SF066_14810, partial [Thermoanaerobaculia bacterium]|nr:hypothetical protein [Thermoanaerobaculia bacterium]